MHPDPTKLDPSPLDRFDCYELCVQSPRHVCSLIHAIAAKHGVEPLTLREDFCGSAAVSRRWIEESLAQPESHPWRGRRATAVDLDDSALARAKALSPDSPNSTIHFLHADCTAKHVPSPSADNPADIIFTGNFSIGYCHARSTLMRYLKGSLARLRPSTGIFACDLYGGPNAFTLGELRRRHPSRNHETIHYLWRHEEADPATGMVTNSISFDIEKDGVIEHQLPRAFVYHWRLWSLPELQDALLEVGFQTVEIYTEANVAPGQTPQQADPAELRQDWVAMVAARC